MPKWHSFRKDKKFTTLRNKIKRKIKQQKTYEYFLYIFFFFFRYFYNVMTDFCCFTPCSSQVTK